MLQCTEPGSSIGNLISGPRYWSPLSHYCPSPSWRWCCLPLYFSLFIFLPSWQTDTHSNSIPASVSSLSNSSYFSFFRPCPLSTKWGYLLVKEAIFFFASRKFSSRVNFGNIVSFVSFPRVRGRPSHFPRPIISDWLSCPAQLRQPISNQIWSFYFKSEIFNL